LINNLKIKLIEIREEKDEDLKEYVHDNEIEIKVVKLSKEIIEIEKLFKDISFSIIIRLINNKIIFERDIDKINLSSLLELRKNLTSKKTNNIFDPKKVLYLLF
jgi:ERCC4-related helicase